MTLVPFLILSLVMCPASRQVSYDTCHPRLVSVSSWSRHFPPTHCPFVYAHAPFKARCATENRVCHEQGMPQATPAARARQRCHATACATACAQSACHAAPPRFATPLERVRTLLCTLASTARMCLSDTTNPFTTNPLPQPIKPCTPEPFRLGFRLYGQRVHSKAQAGKQGSSKKRLRLMACAAFPGVHWIPGVIGCRQLFASAARKRQGGRVPRSCPRTC